MGQLTTSFLFDVERRMRIVSEQSYNRLNANVWWREVAREMPSTGKSERLLWLLDTAQIEPINKLGGEVLFEDIVSRTTEYEVGSSAAGLKLNRNQLDDHDGGGVQLANHWSRQMGAYAAYWPQKQVAAAIRANGTTYDGLAFFHASHPYNPFDSSAGTFANRLTGAASGDYPGAVPISGNTLDVAFENLGKAINYVHTIKMANGVDPRGLRVKKILVPSALVSRAQQLTNAKIIAQAAASGGGGADVEAVISNWGIGSPIEAVELGASFGGSNTSYYLLCEGITGDDVGAFTYVNREPFSIVYNDQMSSDQLARANELQWLTRGRNVVGNGHPYLLFRCEAT